ncbi:hypothetical protein JCGZ_11019 [Jatropha curcas]|uniref:RING-type domain-containing protein n=1 Tax=Jatropha curcas TaxID=180498 RepID=A0A067KEL7_JATCU|nr:hypothetical protein JCGZ_11019 [Jatropha curcas]
MALPRQIFIHCRFEPAIFYSENQEPSFSLRLRISFKYERWLRKLNGEFRLLRTYPISADSSASFNIIPPSALFSSPPFSFIWFLDSELSSLNLENSVHVDLAYYIGQILADMANLRSFLGFHAVVDVNVVSQETVYEPQNSILIFDAVEEGDVVVRPRGGVSTCAIPELKKNGRLLRAAKGSYGDCAICLENLSGAVKVTELNCSHLFHEKCIFQWLGYKNSCPLCRKEIN